MPKKDEESTINSREADNKLGAWLNARDRSDEALADNPEFFTDPDHVRLYEAVEAIADAFFKKKEGIYITHRSNNGNPFTSVKVHKPQWPNVSIADKESRYYKPLKDLGISIHPTATSGIVYRVF